MSNLRYCPKCDKEVEPSIFSADDIWCPNCYSDLRYYDPEAEMEAERAMLMDFEEWSGAMDYVVSTS